jgi:hypothetical protein
MGEEPVAKANTSCPEGVLSDQKAVCDWEKGRFGGQNQRLLRDEVRRDQERYSTFSTDFDYSRTSAHYL